MEQVRLEILDKNDQVIDTEVVDDFNPLDPKDSHRIPEGTRKFRLTLLNNNETEADEPEVFVVGTRSDIISVLEERKCNTQLEMFQKNHSNTPETTEFVAIDQGDMLTHIGILR